MSGTMFKRIASIWNTTNVNIITFRNIQNVRRDSDILLRSYTTNVNELTKQVAEEGEPKSKRMSKAMQYYLQRAKAYHELIEKETIKYELGKRHLANIMGEDVENFTEAKVNKAIEYLLPSGLYDKKARPIMHHPSKIYIRRKEAEFDMTGKPLHFLFYTTKPHYYTILHNIASVMEVLNEAETKFMHAYKELPPPSYKFDLMGSVWQTKEELEKKHFHKYSTSEYDYLIKSLERVAQHPMSMTASEFIMKHRKPLGSTSKKLKILKPLLDNNKRPIVVIKDCKRKSARAKVIVSGNGSGKFDINGKDITYFEDVQSREQILFPLVFTNMLGKVDIKAIVKNGGPTGQSGAIRWGIAMGLLGFVDADMQQKMTVAGLLTKDVRKRERKKPGQEGARRKFTWKRR